MGLADGVRRLPLQDIGYGVYLYWYEASTWVTKDSSGQGAVFQNLPSGYYRAYEYYGWQNGARASRATLLSGSSTQYYCHVP
jgi:hypothetical protein